MARIVSVFLAAATLLVVVAVIFGINELFAVCAFAAALGVLDECLAVRRGNTGAGLSSIISVIVVVALLGAATGLGFELPAGAPRGE